MSMKVCYALNTLDLHAQRQERARADLVSDTPACLYLHLVLLS